MLTFACSPLLSECLSCQTNTPPLVDCQESRSHSPTLKPDSDPPFGSGSVLLQCTCHRPRWLLFPATLFTKSAAISWIKFLAFCKNNAFRFFVCLSKFWSLGRVAATELSVECLIAGILLTKNNIYQLVHFKTVHSVLFFDSMFYIVSLYLIKCHSFWSFQHPKLITTPWLASHLWPNDLMKLLPMHSEGEFFMLPLTLVGLDTCKTVWSIGLWIHYICVIEEELQSQW